MKEFVDKLIGRLEELKTEALDKWDGGASHRAYSKAIDIANELAEEYKDKDCSKCSKRLWYQKGYADAEKEYKVGWVPCSERLPDVETKVLIFAKRKYIGGGFKNIITTAMYEDGTVLENDSKWRWEDLDAEWNEEEDCYIIPEGWWEDKAYNPDGELNHAVDDEVIAWMPLPEPYQQTNERSE